jgi:hypothetical protein
MVEQIILNISGGQIIENRVTSCIKIVYSKDECAMLSSNAKICKKLRVRALGFIMAWAPGGNSTSVLHCLDLPGRGACTMARG